MVGMSKSERSGAACVGCGIVRDRVRCDPGVLYKLLNIPDFPGGYKVARVQRNESRSASFVLTGIIYQGIIQPGILSSQPLKCSSYYPEPNVPCSSPVSSEISSSTLPPSHPPSQHACLLSLHLCAENKTEG